jgi:hypothetical protein
LKNPGDKELRWKIDYQSSNNTSSNALGNNHHATNGSIKSFNSIVPSSNNLSTYNMMNTQPINTVGKSYSQQPDNRFCF